MLSALVHASLVWHEERKIRHEYAEHSASLQAQADDMERLSTPSMQQTTNLNASSTSLLGERTPLMTTTRVLGGAAGYGVSGAPVVPNSSTPSSLINAAGYNGFYSQSQSQRPGYATSQSSRSNRSKGSRGSRNNINGW